MVIVIECLINIRNQRHTQFAQLAHFFLRVVGNPRHFLREPGIYQRLRRENNGLQAANKVLFGFGGANFGHPQQAGKTGVAHAADKIFMVVQIAVQCKRIGGGACTGIAHIRKRSPVAKSVKQALLVQHAEEGVHLLPIQPRGEYAAIGEGPAAGVIAAVAFVQLKA